MAQSYKNTTVVRADVAQKLTGSLMGKGGSVPNIKSTGSSPSPVTGPGKRK